MEAFESDDLARLAAFAIAYDCLDAGHLVAMQLGRYGQAFILARQVGDLPEALNALWRIKSTHPVIAAARNVTWAALKQRAGARIRALMSEWLVHARARLVDFQMNPYELSKKKKDLEEDLMALARNEPARMPVQLADLLGCLQGRLPAANGAELGREFAAWLSVDALRMSVGQYTSNGVDGEHVHRMELQIAEYNSFLQGWEPDVGELMLNINGFLAAAPALTGFYSDNVAGELPLFAEVGVGTSCIPPVAFHFAA